MDNQHPHETVYTTPQFGDEPEGESQEYNDGHNKLVRFADGSAAIGDNDNHHRDMKLDPNDHDQNLAEVLSPEIIRQIGFDLKMEIEEDIESQEEFFAGVAKIIGLLGIDIVNDNDGEDLPFKGATCVFSMALFETWQDILASAVASLYPSTGMVDTVIQGDESPELRDEAYRKKAFFNYYLTQIAKEYRKEGKRTLSWAILAGSCYKKVYIDPVLGRPTGMFIRPEDFIVNRQFSSHLVATRETHILRMDGRELQIRKYAGMYRDSTPMKQEGYRDNDSEIQEQLSEISGFNYDYSRNDEAYCLYECHVDYYIKEDPLSPDFEIAMPYIITLDERSGEVLAIRRNWKEDDFLKKKREYFVNYSLLTSLDGEGYGLVNYAGRLAQAATSVTRQLINAGTYANFPGGIYAAGIRMENNNLRPAPGEFVPIQTGGIPISQVIEALPYKEPSPALKELLEGIEDGIRKPSMIISQKVQELATKAPMGSVLDILKNLQKVPNSILQGFHESFQQELMLFNDRFAEWLPEGQPYPFRVPGGEHVIARKDFEDNVMVVPASDPSLQNSSYRLMLSEIIINQARQGADIHNMRFAYEYFYKNMGLSPEDINQLLPPPPNQQPFSGDPITENQFLMTSKPVTASIMQDHDAHMQVHGLILADPSSLPPQQSAAQAHIQEHKALKFLVEMQQQIGFEMPQDPSQIPPEIQNQIAIAAAQVAAEQMAQQGALRAPEPPLDPARVMLEDVNQKAEIGKLRVAIEEQKVINKQEIDLLKAELAEREFLLKEAKEHHDMLNPPTPNFIKD